MKRHLALLGCLSALVLLAGCGGGGSDGERLSKQEYQQQGAAIGDRLQAEFSDIQNADPANVSEVVPLMSRLADALDALADEFDALNPPENVAAANDALVSAARATAEEARSIGDRIQSEPLAELAKDPTALDISKSASFLRLQKAMSEIEAKGYDFGAATAG